MFREIIRLLRKEDGWGEGCGHSFTYIFTKCLHGPTERQTLCEGVSQALDPLSQNFNLQDAHIRISETVEYCPVICPKLNKLVGNHGAWVAASWSK